jgi:hypothetical protein
VQTTVQFNALYRVGQGALEMEFMERKGCWSEYTWESLGQTTGVHLPVEARDPTKSRHIRHPDSLAAKAEGQ